jgi:hypothetical protein
VEFKFQQKWFQVFLISSPARAACLSGLALPGSAGLVITYKIGNDF